MAKRTAALVVALVLWPTMAAGASPEPQWPCVVPVWIEPGPLAGLARSAVRQLDAATVISWPFVADPSAALVTVRSDPDVDAAFVDLYGTATTMTRAEVWMDSDMPRRWALNGFLHEFGHVVGLDHNDRLSVMGGRSVPLRWFTGWDLDALSEVGCHSS